MADIPSPISGGLRAARTTVSSDVFGGGDSAAQKEALGLLRSNQTALTSISTGLLGIQQRVNILGGSLTQISTQITQSSTLENIRIRQEQDQERRLAEQQIREGKESVIERKIQSALVAPVQAVSQRAQSILEKLKNFFLILLTGWLTNQGIETIRAYREGAKQKLEDIKNSVLSTLGIVGGIFLLVSGGFTRILGLMGKLTKSVLGAVTGAIFVKPLQMLSKAVGLGGGAGAAAKSGTGAGGGFLRGAAGFAGKALTVASGVMDAASGENVDAAMAAGAAFAPGALKIPFGLAYGADAIAEIFGGNIFGKNPNEPEKPKSNEKSKDKPPTTKVSPQETMMGEPAKPKSTSVETPAITQPAPSTTTTATPATTQPAPSTTPPAEQSPTPAATTQPSPEMVKKFEMAWQYRNNPMARGRIESAWNQMSSEEKQQAITWAQSKGYDWNEMRLPAPATIAQVQSTASQTLPTKMEGTAPLPEPSPTVISAPMPSAQMSQSTLPQGSSASTQVPTIPSSNPENFYIMYSQMQYNVVM